MVNINYRLILFDYYYYLIAAIPVGKSRKAKGRLNLSIGNCMVQEVSMKNRTPLLLAAYCCCL